MDVDPRTQATQATQALPGVVRLVALLAVCGGQALLLVPGRGRWRAETGCTLVPVELPGGLAREGEPDERALRRVARARLGVEVRLPHAGWSFGRSPEHAIDRRPVAPGRLAPLAEVTPANPADGAARPQPWVARVYRGEVLGSLRSRTCAGALWLTPAALRALVPGLPLVEVLARPDARWEPLGADPPPDDALAYLPSDYGERYLLRAAGKYGARAVFGEEVADGW